ncbi:MAG: 16S rRNA (adenine(1518)-N(6)/adenine(1519)-N(6))-dimethyltransferase RsmA [Deltaproteobacteria bacterium]|nr:16S rRNA (adenine(1518)-N(6)/adenine(1519)-N(6))-dimethyltransferase RsmA [Deltaproteobacteria bacterium]
MVSLYQEARAVVRDGSFKPRKRLGQNFLVDEGILNAIVRLVDPAPQDEVVEIGPGLGFLTRRLVTVARRVWAIEVDSFLVERLRQSSSGSHPALELLHADFLKIPLNDVLPPGKVKLVANLPYSISTPALFRIFDFREHFSLLVLMLQKEVADRLIAEPGTKAYGSLSVWFRIHGHILDKVSVSPEAFFPRPKVRSTVLKIGLHREPLVRETDCPMLHTLVRAAFGQRRKMLSNAVAGALGKDRAEVAQTLGGAGIDPRRRGETLTVDEFIRLARALKETGLTADS